MLSLTLAQGQYIQLSQQGINENTGFSSHGYGLVDIIRE